MSDTGPKIHIDDDWKAQAQREKERLAAKQSSGQPAKPAGGSSSAASSATASDPQPRRPREMPPATFETLVNQLASQALLYMGAMPDPRGQQFVSLETARHQIDLLAMLETKAAGGMTDDEASALAGTLYELRETYLNVSKVMRDQALGRDLRAAG